MSNPCCARESCGIDGFDESRACRDRIKQKGSPKKAYEGCPDNTDRQCMHRTKSTNYTLKCSRQGIPTTVKVIREISDSTRLNFCRCHNKMFHEEYYKKWNSLGKNIGEEQINDLINYLRTLVDGI